MTQDDIDAMHLAVCREIFNQILPRSVSPLVVYDVGYEIPNSWIEVCPECMGQRETRVCLTWKHIQPPTDLVMRCDVCGGRGWLRYVDIRPMERR
jgi:hypothetical protein